MLNCNHALSHMLQQESQGHRNSSLRKAPSVWMIVWGQPSTQPAMHVQRLLNTDWRYLSHTRYLHLTLRSTSMMPYADKLLRIGAGIPRILWMLSQGHRTQEAAQLQLKLPAHLFN